MLNYILNNKLSTKTKDGFTLYKELELRKY